MSLSNNLSNLIGQVNRITGNKMQDTKFSLDNFSDDAQDAICQAQKMSDDRKHKGVSPMHLFLVILNSSKVRSKLEKSDLENLNRASNLCLESAPKSFSETAYLSKSLISILNDLVKNSKNPPNSIDILVALSIIDTDVASICRGHSVDMANLFKEEQLISSSSNIINLTSFAKNNQLGTVVGREKETQRLIQIIGKQEKRHALILGLKGVGKKTIVNSLAYKVIGRTDKNLNNTIVLRSEAFKFIEGAKSRKDIEDRVETMLSSVPDCRVIFHLNNTERLFDQKGLSNIGNDLLDVLVGKVNLILTVSLENYKKNYEREDFFARQFSILNIDPVSDKQAIEILRGISHKYEKYHNLQIGNKEIETCVKLAKRYIQDRNLPESAIDLLDEAAANQKIEIDGIPSKIEVAMGRLSSLRSQMRCLSYGKNPAHKKEKHKIEQEINVLDTLISSHLKDEGDEKETEDERILTEENIAAVLESWTGIPVAKALEGDVNKLANVESQLSKRVVGQNEAIEALAKSIRRNSSGLREQGKPIGSFLFLGSSGTGKTEVAKAVAEFLFDDEKALTRIDMSEFMERHMAQRLIGAPPGYANADEGGFLTEAVKRKPYSVLLFDEVEKGHHDVFNLLLQLLDDGRLTDGRGRTVDFSNTVVIMTSNIGSLRILDAGSEAFETEEGRNQLKEDLREDMKKVLRPELINRIDEITIFNPLSKSTLRAILDIQIKRLEKMMAEKEIKLSLSEDAKDRLIEIDYEPAFGARPLKRAVLKHIQDPLSQLLLTGKLHNKTVHFSYSDNSFSMSHS